MDDNVLKINLAIMHSDNMPVICGYCKDPITNKYKNTAYKYYLNLKSIPIDIYEEMISKGWARAGSKVYLNIYDKTYVINYINQD